MKYPRFLYGTAWKEDDTARCVRDALNAGFRSIDTANQRKHYHEVGAGEAIADFISSGTIGRADLFLQSKFTFEGGQDHRLPYDPKDPISKQVQDSFAGSLQNLQTDYLDSYVLHGPLTSRGLTAADWEAWSAIEHLKSSGKVKYIGVSNVNLEQLTEFTNSAALKPTFVQNRCYAQTGWDKSIRNFCEDNGIIYQGFSLLTANMDYFQHPKFLEIMKKNQLTTAQLVFAFARQIGMIPMTGTTNPKHMDEDIYSLEVKLPLTDVTFLELIAL